MDRAELTTEQVGDPIVRLLIFLSLFLMIFKEKFNLNFLLFSLHIQWITILVPFGL